ncbi:hypothetical protein [Psychromonas hadalis]|uniref:hypothetical protein n=1 Tax=Psychromonas hadalis TaxID=211669 RepID=UPI0003B70FDA|nr:hypothetical protein [Psychromonas hadalis]
MKKLLALIVLCTVTLASQAIPMQWEERLDFDDVYFSGKHKGGVKSYTYTHDLKAVGFSPEQDYVGNYNLSINLFDDGDKDRWFDKGTEWASISQPGFWGDRTVEVSYKDVDLGVSWRGWYSLNLDGLLEITIKRLKGDFYLGGSTLTATGRGHASKIPEPAPFILFSLAMIGLFIAPRKRRR